MRFVSFAAVLTTTLAVAVSLAGVAQAQPRGRMVVFDDINFGGGQRVIDGDVRDFRDIGMNDRVSSIRIESGTWQVCEDADYRGRCMTVSSDDRTLVPDGFNDRISSARMVASVSGNGGSGNGGGRNDDRRGDTGGFGNRTDNRTDNRAGDRGGAQRAAGIELFADAYYRGGNIALVDDIRDLRSMDFNDVVSSLRIVSGSWEVCEDADFRGRCMTFDRDVDSLEGYRFNDRVSSVRRVR